MRVALETIEHGGEFVPSAEQGPPAIDTGASAPRLEAVPSTPTPSTGPTITAVAVTPTDGEAPHAVTGSRIELDVPAQWRPGQSARSPLQPPRSGLRINWGWLLMVAALLAAGGGAWMYWDDLTGTGGTTGRHRSGETVLLLVDTKPRDAIVFVDDVQRDERPIELPASD